MPKNKKDKEILQVNGLSVNETIVIILVFIILIILILISTLDWINFLPKEKLKFSNPPCWYYINETIREIQIYGANNTEDVHVFTNQDKSKFFVMDIKLNETISECIKDG